MKSYQFSGLSQEQESFQFAINVEDAATQDEVAEEIEDVLDAEHIQPQGTVVVRRIPSSDWGEFEE